MQAGLGAGRGGSMAGFREEAEWSQALIHEDGVAGQRGGVLRDPSSKGG